MLDLLRGLKSLVKLSHVQIDSSIFRLHYTITVMACLAFSLLVTARQYVGNPIDCVHTKDIPEVSQDLRFKHRKINQCQVKAQFQFQISNFRIAERQNWDFKEKSFALVESKLVLFW